MSLRPVPVLVGDQIMLAIDGRRRSVAPFEIYPGVTLVTGDERMASALLRALAGVERPAAGTVRWGQGLRRAVTTGEFSRVRTYVGTEPIEDGQLRVLDWFALTARLWDVPDPHAAFAQRAHEWGLDPFLHRRIDTLSPGYVQRLLLAGSLVPAPAVWILDDPARRLDHDGRLLLERTLEAPGLPRPETVILTRTAPFALPADNVQVIVR